MHKLPACGGERIRKEPLHEVAASHVDLLPRLCQEAILQQIQEVELHLPVKVELIYILIFNKELQQTSLHVAVAAADQTEVALVDAYSLLIDFSPLGTVVIVSAQHDEVLERVIGPVAIYVMNFDLGLSARRDCASVARLDEHFAPPSGLHVGARWL